MSIGDTILIVDDEPDIPRLLNSYLRRDGLVPLVASTGAEAVAKAREERPALIVLDIMLPDFDGFEVCRRVRRFSDCPIIFLTARAEEADKVLGFGLGADDYVIKPFSPRELVERIKANLRRSARNREHSEETNASASAWTEASGTPSSSTSAWPAAAANSSSPASASTRPAAVANSSPSASTWAMASIPPASSAPNWTTASTAQSPSAPASTMPPISCSSPTPAPATTSDSPSTQSPIMASASASASTTDPGMPMAQSSTSPLSTAWPSASSQATAPPASWPWPSPSTSPSSASADPQRSTRMKKAVFDDCVLDIESYQLLVRGSEVQMTSKEFCLLKHLVTSANRVLTKKQLFEAVWEEEWGGDDNTVMVHIHRLRQKIEADPSAPKRIVTIRGIGYKFAGEVDWIAD